MTINATQEEVDFLRMTQTEISTAEQALHIPQEITPEQMNAYLSIVMNTLTAARAKQALFWDEFKKKYGITQAVFSANIAYDTNVIELSFGDVN